MQEESIVHALRSALEKLDISGIEPELEHPAELLHGDYATNVVLVAAKQIGENPKTCAEKIVAALESIEGVEKIEVAGRGFINFHLGRTVFIESVHHILSKPDTWGSNEDAKGRKIVVEYSQPNPFKPFHIGHLMSTTIGESLSRLFEWAGAKVFRAKYPRDI